MRKPEPVNKNVVCSVCGMDWPAHGEKPTLEKCVELLAAELARRPKHPWYGINQPAVSYSSQASYLPQARGIASGDDQIGKAH